MGKFFAALDLGPMTLKVKVMDHFSESLHSSHFKFGDHDYLGVVLCLVTFDLGPVTLNV